MIDQLIVIFYLSIILLIGIFAGRKTKDIEVFSVAGRNIPFFLIFATISASFIGLSSTLGNAEKVFLFGITNIFALLGFSLREILIAKFIAPQMEYHANCISIGDLIGKHYGKFAKILTGLFSLFICTVILSAQITIIGYLLNLFFGIELLYGVLVGAVIMIIYSTIGGIKSVIYTHLLQFIMIAIAIPIILYFGVIQAGGWTNIISAVPQKHLSVFGDLSIVAFFSLFFSFMLGEMLLPPYVQRLLISKNPKSLSRAILLNGVLSIFIFTATGLIGLVAYVLFGNTIEAGMAIPQIVMTLLPTGIKGIVIAGTISIIMSSADAFLNSASIAITNDIMKPIFKDSEGVGSIWTARIFTIIIGVIAILLALYIKNISDLLLNSYKFWAPIIVIPLIFAILEIKSSKEQFYQSTIAAIIGVSVWSYLLHEPFEINGLIIGFITSTLVFISVRLLVKKT